MKNKHHWKIFLTTLLALAGVLVLIRLGLWQLDRLQWRRNFNTHYLQQLTLPALNINKNSENPVLLESEYRQANAIGRYDFGGEVYLQNQAYQNRPGYRVLTPFLLDESGKIVYVERGWVSMDDIDSMNVINQSARDDRQISGVIRLSQQKNSYGVDPDADKKEASRFWLIVNLQKLQERESREVLPIYIQMTDQVKNGLPIPVPNEIEISEGPHMGYAIQWFFFAALLAGGYPFFIKKMLQKPTVQKEIIDDDY